MGDVEYRASRTCTLFANFCSCYSCPRFNGQASECLLDGDIGSTNWFYCVGYYGSNWGQGLAIPSYQRAAQAVEVLARNPKTQDFDVRFLTFLSL